MSRTDSARPGEPAASQPSSQPATQPAEPPAAASSGPRRLPIYTEPQTTAPAAAAASAPAASASSSPPEGEAGSLVPTTLPSTEPAAPSELAPATQLAAEAVSPISQPATGPSLADDPRRSPATMVGEFLRALNESEKTPKRMRDAVKCLNFGKLRKTDPEAVAQQGPVLARQLEEIIEALLNNYGKSRDEIPREPEGDVVYFPAEPTDNGIQLQITRNPEGLWRFSEETLAAVPTFLQAIKQTRTEETRETPKDEAAATVPPAYRTPRATMRTFLEAMSAGDKAAAAACLDLSEQPAATAAEMGAKLADQLLYAMDRIAVVVYQDLPDKTDGPPYAWYMSEQGRIEVARQTSGPRQGHWLFTRATVNSIETLFREMQGKPRLAELAKPSFWKNPRLWLLETIPKDLQSDFLGVQRWQWIGIGILLVVGYIVHRLALLILSALARPLGRTQEMEFLPGRITTAVRPLAMLVMLGTWWGGLQLLLIPTEILTFVWPALNFIMTAVGVWASYRLIDLGSDVVSTRASRRGARVDEVLLPLARKTLKIVILALGSIFVLKALGVERYTIDRLFAGLGLGGLAFALAAQESLKNFFGSITVILDRPFQVGDYIKVGAIEGTVESVGLRSTRIRTFYSSQVTIPNADLTVGAVDNLGRRQYRRMNCAIAVLYSTTPEQLEAFCEGIREIIRRHPLTRKDNYAVWVNAFAPSSIDILLNCFFTAPDWNTELRERHRLLLDIVRLARRLGVEFAFPTQTVHLSRAKAESPPALPVAGSLREAADQAIRFGREEAERIVADSLGDPAKIPPKYEFPEVKP